MKTIKITAVVIALVMLFPILTFSELSKSTLLPPASNTINPGNVNLPMTGTTQKPGGTTVNPGTVFPSNPGQLNPNSVFGYDLVSSMNVSVYADFDSKKVIIDVHDSKMSDTSHGFTMGFVYPEMAVTIQRMAQGETAYKDIGIAQYKVESYTPWLSSMTYTDGTASFEDTNITIGQSYYYRIKHLYQSKTYYTAPKSVTFPIEDSKSLKLTEAKRVDLYFDESWTPAAGDEYKYELKRRLGFGEYETISEVSPDNRLISDIITNPVAGGNYYYIISATCTKSSVSSKVGKSVESQPVIIKIED